MDFPDFAYRGVTPIPTHLPSWDGAPLFPDPHIYPPSILEGFHKWAELYFDPDQQALTYRVIDPRDESLKQKWNLGEGDRVSKLLQLLGPPEKQRSHKGQKMRTYHYSPDVAIGVEGDMVMKVFLRVDKAIDRLPSIAFVFLDSSVEEYKSG